MSLIAPSIRGCIVFPISRTIARTAISTKTNKATTLSGALFYISTYKVKIGKFQPPISHIFVLELQGLSILYIFKTLGTILWDKESLCSTSTGKN